jgi:hypothetical protein
MTEEKVNMQTGEIVSTVGEMSSSLVAREFAETQATIMVAQHNRRNLPNIKQKVQTACSIRELAVHDDGRLKGLYSYPRGGKKIEGMAVYVARPLAAIYGNMQYGFEISFISAVEVGVRAWAWDTENNTRVYESGIYKKLIQRKNPNTKKTEWIEPDERDLRELIHRNAAKLVRNCILHLIPEDIKVLARKYILKAAAGEIKNADKERDRLLEIFIKYGVTVEMVERYLGNKKVTDWLPADLVTLQGIVNAVRNEGASMDGFFTVVQKSTATTDSKKVDEALNNMKAGKPEDHREVYDDNKSKDAGKPTQDNSSMAATEDNNSDNVENADTSMAGPAKPLDQIDDKDAGQTKHDGDHEKAGDDIDSKKATGEPASDDDLLILGELMRRKNFAPNKMAQAGRDIVNKLTEAGKLTDRDAKIYVKMFSKLQDKKK